MTERLKTDSFFSDIISWKLRLFVSTAGIGTGFLEKVLERCPVERIAGGKAA